MANYLMNVLRIAKKNLQTVERKQASFYWVQAKITSVDSLLGIIYRSCLQGGLGIRNPFLIIQALLFKHV